MVQAASSSLDGSKFKEKQVLYKHFSCIVLQKKKKIERKMCPMNMTDVNDGFVYSGTLLVFFVVFLNVCARVCM